MKIIIKTKSTESRNNILNLLTKNLKYKCSCVPGFYNVDNRKTRDELSYYTNINDWNINIQGGHFKEKESSALKHGTDKDSVNNKSIGINLSNWYNNINFKTTFFTRNTFSAFCCHLSFNTFKYSILSSFSCSVIFLL